MTILETLYASAGSDVIIITLELTCPAWSGPELICNGFEDQTCTTEDARTLTFIAQGIDASLPKKNNTGSQTIQFAIVDFTGAVQSRVEDSLEAGERVTLTLRTYVASDKSAPAEAPYRFAVQGGKLQGGVAQIVAGFFDLLNTRFPRDLYTTEFCPGIKYL